jgi:hypothetical protein
MDTRVIIFTNKTSLETLTESTDKKILHTLAISDNGNSILATSQCLGFNEQSNKFEKLTTAHKIIFVQDTIDNLNNCTILEGIIIAAERLIILKHKKPVNSIIIAINTSRAQNSPPEIRDQNTKHEKDNGFYHKMFQILCDSEKNKHNRIVELLGINLVLEAQLIINKFLNIYLRDKKEKATQAEAYTIVTEKLKLKIPGLNLTDPLKNEKWISGWKDFGTNENGKLNDTIINELNEKLFATENA